MSNHSFNLLKAIKTWKRLPKFLILIIFMHETATTVYNCIGEILWIGHDCKKIPHFVRDDTKLLFLLHGCIPNTHKIMFWDDKRFYFVTGKTLEWYKKWYLLGQLCSHNDLTTESGDWPIRLKYSRQPCNKSIIWNIKLAISSWITALSYNVIILNYTSH